MFNDKCADQQENKRKANKVHAVSQRQYAFRNRFKAHQKAERCKRV